MSLRTDNADIRRMGQYELFRITELQKVRDLECLLNFNCHFISLVYKSANPIPTKSINVQLSCNNLIPLLMLDDLAPLVVEGCDEDEVVARIVFEALLLEIEVPEDVDSEMKLDNDEPLCEVEGADEPLDAPEPEDTKVNSDDRELEDNPKDALCSAR
jgi:hypothetical protein